MTVTLSTIPPAIHPPDWELHVHLHGDDHAPRLCRRAVVGAVREYGVAVLAGDGGLVASELMTNAVRHGRGRVSFRVAWCAKRERLRITVWDGGLSRAPVSPSRPPDDAESGRGLLLVAALAADWGQYSMPAGGKAIWAELRLELACGTE